LKLTPASIGCIAGCEPPPLRTGKTPRAAGVRDLRSGLAVMLVYNMPAMGSKQPEFWATQQRG